MSLTDSIDRLNNTIEESRNLLNSIYVRSGHLVLQQVLVRYLHYAIAAAEVNCIVAAARHPMGAAPVTRALFEISVDIMYLLTAPDSHKEAARTLLWSVLEWDRQWGFRRAVDKADATIAKEVQQMETADEAMKGFIEHLREAGEEVSALEELYAEAQKRKKSHWHWSGIPRKQMIEILGERGDPTLFALLSALWPVLSDEAHPSPSWHRMKLEFTEHGDAILRDPAADDEVSVARFADQTTAMLQVVHHLIERHYQRDRDELQRSPPS